MRLLLPSLLRFRLALAGLAAVAALACSPAVQERVVLQPEGEAVEFAMETPSKDAYEVVGTVKATAAGKTIGDATDAARNDLRNKAAALGATLVIEDKTDTSQDIIREKRIVTITGRAFRAKP